LTSEKETTTEIRVGESDRGERGIEQGESASSLVREGRNREEEGLASGREEAWPSVIERGGVENKCEVTEGVEQRGSRRK
jgi:hypothetical protein